jgi:phenylpropionate dioxygenase-like ring-hydroxylating dioxygenase large terminal subunit
MTTTLLNDAGIAERVFHHIANGTTDMCDEVWREPVANYRMKERLEREIRHVLRRSPAPFCPSAALPEAGSYVARSAAGTPIVAVRGRDGAVRAFRNVCRHRGMEVVSGSGCAKVFVCGYHGWAYGLEGKLQHVPHEHGFPGLDKETHGLVPVAALERNGIVFVRQEGGEAAADEAALGALPQLIAADQKLLWVNERDTEANWKIVLEGFIEGYHIKATHAESFYPYGFDNLNVVETFGRNSRVIYPFRRIEKLKTVPPAECNLTGYVTYVYQLFPNALLIMLSEHTSLVVLEPVAIDKTRVFTYTLSHRGAGGEEALAKAKRDADFVANTGLVEDRAVVCAIQRGLDSGANEVFTFGRFEPAIVHFHRTLDAALEA